MGFPPFVFWVVLMSGRHFDFSLFLQELKKKKGIKEELQLTSKQKEMMQIQLEKEAAIRKRLQGVWNQVTKNEFSKTVVLNFSLLSCGLLLVVTSWTWSCRAWWVCWMPL